MHKFATILFLLLASQLLLAAPVKLYFAGLDENGRVFMHGSGYWNQQTPLVSDQRELVFTAQVPEEACSESFMALYGYTAGDTVSQVISAGYFKIPFSEEKWYRTHWAYAVNNFIVLEKQTDSSGGSRLDLLQIVANSDPVSLISLNELLPARQTLQIHQGGNLLALSGNLDQPLFFEKTNDGQLARLMDFPELPCYDRKDIAISPEGNEIYFCSAEYDEFGEGMLTLYAIRHSDATLTRIALLGALQGANSIKEARLQAAANARTIVFCNHWPDKLIPGINGKQICVAWAWPDSTGTWQFQACSTDEKLSEPDEPQLSADGRFVVFSAKTSGSAQRQIFRFDRLRQKLQLVSQNPDELPANANCLAPGISPNGRYVGFISAANNLGRTDISKPQVWLADLGPSLSPACLDIFQEQRLQIPITITACGDDAVVELGTSSAAGSFYDKDNNKLTPGQACAVSSLPWYYEADADEVGTHEITLTITEDIFSDSINLQIRIQETGSALLSCVSLNNQGEFISGNNRNFSDAACCESGEYLAFVTSLPILTDNPNNVSHAYLRNISLNTLVLLSEGLASVEKISLSGNGELLYFISADKLWQYDINEAQRSEFISEDVDDVKPALDHSGKIIAYSKAKKVVLQANTQIIKEFDLECSSLQLNRDGSVLLMLDTDKKLYAYFVDEPAPQQEPQFVAADIDEFTMNQSGTELIYRNNMQLFKFNTCTGDQTELELPDALQGLSLINLHLSGNGRYLAWVRDLVVAGEASKKQQFIYELSTARELLISQSADNPGNGDAGILFAPINAAGNQLFFASDANNLVDGDNNSAQDLFMASMQEQQADMVMLSSDEFTVNEDEIAILELQLQSTLGNALVPILETDTSAKDADLQLLGPVPGREAYALRYSPQQNYCGLDNLELRIWDGSRMSDAFTLQIIVQNVNDPPTATDQPRIELEEDEELSIDLCAYADDPDLYNEREEDRDELSFALPENPPDWLGLEGKSLTLRPGYDLVKHPESNKNIDLDITVSDKAGETITTIVKLHIKDVNRPPQLTLNQNSILQTDDTIVLQPAWFEANDPDLEDQANLRIILRYAGQDEQDITEQLPYSFIPPESAVNELQLEFFAQDSLGASSEPCQLTVLLRKVNFNAAALWGYEPDSSSWRDLHTGWNLLALPWALNSNEIEVLFGCTPSTLKLQVWDAEKRAYQNTKTLFAGQGFWIYLDNLSNINNGEVVLATGRQEAPPLQPGWNLIGPTWQDENTEQNKLFKLEQKNIWQKSESLKPGKASWWFEP